MTRYTQYPYCLGIRFYAPVQNKLSNIIGRDPDYRKDDLDCYWYFQSEAEAEQAKWLLANRADDWDRVGQSDEGYGRLAP